jgi:hypothetical protein
MNRDLPSTLIFLFFSAPWGKEDPHVWNEQGLDQALVF